METANVEQLHRHAERKAQEPVTAFVRIARVREISGFSKSTLWRWIKAGKFPRPVIEEGNSVLWDLGEIETWRGEQFAKRERRIAAEAQTKSEAGKC